MKSYLPSLSPKSLACLGLLGMVAWSLTSGRPPIVAPGSPSVVTAAANFQEDSLAATNPRQTADSPQRLAALASSWGKEPEVVFQEFSAWAGQYSASQVQALPAMEAEGLRLAQARRTALRELIQSDPKAALDRSVPATVLPKLPAEVRAELEERISGIGRFSVVVATPQRGKSLANTTLRRVTMGNRGWEASVYGDRLNQRTTDRDSLHGIALDGTMAVLESPLRQLEPGEQPTPGKPVAVDLRGSHDVADTAPVEPGVTLESGEAVFHACCQRDLPRLELQWLQAFGGPQSDGERAKP